MRIRFFHGVVPLLAALFGAVAGCAPKRAAVSTPPLVVYPPPPDTARIQFLTRISGSRDIEPERGRSFLDALLGEEQEVVVKSIVKPYGIAIGGGRIYVCDAMLPGLEVIDLEGRTFSHLRPRGLSKPINCSLDPTEGRLYVTDTHERRVVVFDPEGNVVGTIGGGNDSSPTDVFVRGDTVWVSDMGAQQVRAYHKGTHELLLSFPEVSAATDEKTHDMLYTPINLHVIENRVYVSDFGDFRIKVYSLDGEFLQSIGGYGRGLGQFVRPKGIAVDRDLNLYVVDAGFQNVQVFDRDGNLLLVFGGNYSGPGDMWLPAQVTIDYDNLSYFQQYVDPRFSLKYLILVTNQYGPDKVNVYGFVEPKRDTLGATN